MSTRKLTKALALLMLWLPFGLAQAGDSILATGTVQLDPLLSHYLSQGLRLELSVGEVNTRAIPNGPFKIVTAGGKVVLSGHFLGGVFDSDLKSYGPAEELLSVARYRNGVLYGAIVEWDSMGMVKRITPHNDSGKKHGVERYFAKNAIMMEIAWENDDPKEIRKYDDSGNFEVLHGDLMWRAIRKQALIQAGE